MTIRELLHSEAIKYLENDLLEYKEKKQVWEKKKLMLLGEQNYWTKRDLESEVIYWEVEVKKSAFKVADNLSVLSLENKSFLDIFKKVEGYQGIKEAVSNNYINKFEAENKKLKEKIKELEEKKWSPVILDDEYDDDKNRRERDIREEEERQKEIDKEINHQINKQPHCIGCANSKSKVCKKHAAKPLDLSNPEDMKKYKKQWREKKKSTK